MKRRLPLLLLALVAALFAAGLYWLFELRISGGDVFPPYSSMRADPLGTRGFYEALESLPGLNVERSLKPLEKLEAPPPRTIFLVGMSRSGWEAAPVNVSNALDAAVRAGSRLVVIFAAEQERLEDDEADTEDDPEVKPVKPTKSEKVDKKEPSGGRRAKELPAATAILFTDWTRLWGAKIERRLIMDRNEGARAVESDENFPSTVPWRSDLYFTPTKGSGWKVLYTRGASPVLMEMELGKGSVVFASDAYFVSNEALQKNREPALLAWLVGGHRRLLFDESHLGVEKERGVAGLARHYGLAGGFLLFVLLALLFVWQRAALFIPPAQEETELQLSYNQTAGLEALLRRVLPATQLMPTCAKEWARTARPSDATKLEALLRAQPPKTPAIDQYNAAVRAFRRR